MKVYHYTSIETLALILKNKTIRFNRLDQVDDIEESEYKTGNDTKFGKYAFASCWTKNKDEDIALWKLYADGANGIRICMDSNMFMNYIVPKDSVVPELIKNTCYYLSPEKVIMNDYIVISNDLPNDFCRDVIYTPTPDLESSHSSIMISEKEIIPILDKIGIYKHIRWEFQSESRFLLYALPIDRKNKKMTIEDITLFVKNNKKVPIDYIDVPISKKCFDEIEITLSPCIDFNHPNKIIIDSLINAYCQTAKVLTSSLLGKIRYK